MIFCVFIQTTSFKRFKVETKILFFFFVAWIYTFCSSLIAEDKKQIFFIISYYFKPQKIIARCHTLCAFFVCWRRRQMKTHFSSNIKSFTKIPNSTFSPNFFFLITESSMGASCTTEIFFFFIFDSFPQFDILKTFSIAYFNHNFSLMYQSSWRREQLPATAFAGSVPLSASIIWIYML